ncbi:MAG TPA: RDD family protein [Lacunisphaera sp.]|nr:RDD family protein [Lacunisphaera sp.]
MYTILGADGKEYGPVTAAHIHEWIRDGRANHETKARFGGEGPWKPLGSFPEFGGHANPAAASPASPPRVVVANRATSHQAGEAASRLLRLPAATFDWLLKVLAILPITIPLARAAMADAESGVQHTIAELYERSNQIVLEKAPDALPFVAGLLVIQVVLLSWRGQSVGKLLLGIRIVAANGAPAGFARAFVLRGLLPFIIEQIPLFGLLFLFVDSCFIFRDDRRCLHDLIAGTVVVKA